MVFSLGLKKILGRFFKPLSKNPCFSLPLGNGFLGGFIDFP
jgi:hypothetical protein